NPAANQDTAARLGEIATATLCLPEFQLHALAGDEQSPNLVVLGDSDGGLFGVLTHHVAWFEPWLIEGFSQPADRSGSGPNMCCMTDRDVALLAQSLGLESHCSTAPQPEHCLAALTHLSALLDTALSRPEYAIVVSDSG